MHFCDCLAVGMELFWSAFNWRLIEGVPWTPQYHITKWCSGEMEGFRGVLNCPPMMPSGDNLSEYCKEYYCRNSAHPWQHARSIDIVMFCAGGISTPIRRTCFRGAPASPMHGDLVTTPPHYPPPSQRQYVTEGFEERPHLGPHCAERLVKMSAVSVQCIAVPSLCTWH